MGKTRGHGTRRGGSKGRGRGPARGRGEDEDSSEEEYEPQQRAAKADDKGDKEAKASAGQSRNAGKLPPSGSEDEEEDEDSEDEESSDDAPEPAYLAQPAAPRKKWAGELGLLGTAAGCGADGGYWRSSGQKDDDEPDPAQIRKDMERLELIKNRREQDRLKRIRDEGWDRYAPISDTNKP
ncbi:hypothetical protein MNEG_0469 [Monoraphidium neglectum]|uniref:Uncharacterized protein n=1 Tax=Monoraphidium neglectum TaxID=145388 RepID=A0A0D2N5B3_9CHLO|nr:hypothetical protein MNEG_0469 [Monoraphidium neglectum]KIZ07482.1 hypothetical protein MNEG_0469 [Monoraphidium neglectum]|eukprot:XP_013906501.1 hypothetical protein MNEG_0469 [Monoraphidium neglectum]